MQDVDYEATMSAKLSIAKKVFNFEKDKVLNSGSFLKFFSENEVNDRILLDLSCGYKMYDMTVIYIYLTFLFLCALF